MKREELYSKRDDLLRQLWCVFNDIASLGSDNFANEDLDLWSQVTSHSSIQKRLDDQKGK